MIGKKITVVLSEQELAQVISGLEYILQDALMTGDKYDYEQEWALTNSIVQKLKTVQSQAQM